MKNPPPAVASSSAVTQAERDFYAAPDDGAIHILVTRPGKGIRHVRVPISGPDTRRQVQALAERFFGKGAAGGEA